MEPFRPACADLIVLNLMSHRRMVPDRHFEPMDGDGGVHLTADGREVVFCAYDTAMERKCRPGQSGVGFPPGRSGKLSWRTERIRTRPRSVKR